METGGLAQPIPESRQKAPRATKVKPEHKDPRVKKAIRDIKEKTD